MFIETTGNISESQAEALVNTVNTAGVMGKGVALQFKKSFPENFKAYQKACKEGRVEIGKMFVYEGVSLLHGKKLIINFPTKTDWRKPSEYEYIERGLKDLVRVVNEYRLKSIAIPPLGAGNGGLDWSIVREMITRYLHEVDCEVYLYEPNAELKDALLKERAKLTPARAMLLAVLFDLVREGELVSEFACEKICYFLQRFGAEKDLKLSFKPQTYGPYSGKVRHLLYTLNGSYLAGYSDKDRKPFEALNLVMDSEKDVLAFLEKYPEQKAIVEKTRAFLSGWYSAFALELLSSVDFIAKSEGKYDYETVLRKLREWNTRKNRLFAKEEFVEKAVEQLESAQLISRSKSERPSGLSDRPMP
ncbi:MAG: macro domain-containing protein [Chloroherpetonaceae bacterium]